MELDLGDIEVLLKAFECADAFKDTQADLVEGSGVDGAAFEQNFVALFVALVELEGIFGEFDLAFERVALSFEAIKFEAVGAAIDAKKGLVALNGLPGFEIAQGVSQLAGDFGDDLDALIGLCGAEAIEVQPEIFAHDAFGLYAQRQSLRRFALGFFSHIHKEAHGHHANDKDQSGGDRCTEDTRCGGRSVMVGSLERFGHGTPRSWFALRDQAWGEENRRCLDAQKSQGVWLFCEGFMRRVLQKRKTLFWGGT